MGSGIAGRGQLGPAGDLVLYRLALEDAVRWLPIRNRRVEQRVTPTIEVDPNPR